MYTACYDGMVRQYDLSTGRLFGTVVDHGPYAVEALQLGPDPTARLVSVDWSGVVGCSPSTECWASRQTRGAADVETLVYGRERTVLSSRSSSGWGKGSHNDACRVFRSMLVLRMSYRLAPTMDPSSRRLLQYRRLGPREEPAEVADAHMTSSVGCLVHDDDRMLLGTADGRVVSLLFRGGL